MKTKIILLELAPWFIGLAVLILLAFAEYLRNRAIFYRNPVGKRCICKTDGNDAGTVMADNGNNIYRVLKDNGGTRYFNIKNIGYEYW